MFLRQLYSLVFANGNHTGQCNSLVGQTDLSESSLRSYSHLIADSDCIRECNKVKSIPGVQLLIPALDSYVCNSMFWMYRCTSGKGNRTAALYIGCSSPPGRLPHLLHPPHIPGGASLFPLPSSSGARSCDDASCSTRRGFRQWKAAGSGSYGEWRTSLWEGGGEGSCVVPHVPYYIPFLFTNCRFCTSSCSGAMLLAGSTVTNLKNVGCSYWV